MRREDNIGKSDVFFCFSDRGQQSSHVSFYRIYLTTVFILPTITWYSWVQKKMSQYDIYMKDALCDPQIKITFLSTHNDSIYCRVSAGLMKGTSLKESSVDAC